MWETSAKASATQIWARLLWDSPAGNLKVDLRSLSTADALSGALLLQIAEIHKILAEKPRGSA